MGVADGSPRRAAAERDPLAGRFAGFREPLFIAQALCGRLQIAACLRCGAFNRGYHAFRAGLRGLEERNASVALNPAGRPDFPEIRTAGLAPSTRSTTIVQQSTD